MQVEPVDLTDGLDQTDNGESRVNDGCFVLSLGNLIVPFIEIRKTEGVTVFRIRENTCASLKGKIYESMKKAVKYISNLGRSQGWR